MTKFKVGDRVRLTSDENEHLGLVVGDVGTVAEDSCVPYVDWDRIADRWAVIEGEIELIAPSRTIQAGKFYKTSDGRKVGPAFISGSIATFGEQNNHASAVWADNGRQSARSDLVSTTDNDIIAEWVDEPVASATAPFKVGDRVRLTERNDYDRWGAKGEEGTVLIGDDGARDCHVDFDVAGEWCASWDILELVAAAPPTTIKVGDWVRTDNGEIGIVLHDDGSEFLQFKVGFVGDDNDEHWDWHSDLQLTVVPPGTAKASNDNAPILAEIDELEQRLSDLRSKLAA